MDASALPASKRVPAGPLRPWLLPLCRGFERVAMAMLVVATSAIMVEVVARGVFARGLPGAGELARFAGLALIFLTVPQLLAQGTHVKVDLLSTRASGLPRRLLDILNEVATLAFCAVFLLACWWFMQRAARFSSPALEIPNLVYYAPAMAGMVLTTLVAADRLLGLMLGSQSQPEEARP
jgi:TRAP-type C4-dicarboxylate transport system permease small subunit